MKKKLFVSVDIPDEVKKELLVLKDSFSNLPIKWVEMNKIHLTLASFGLAEPREVVELIESAVRDIIPFQLKITSVSYQPEGEIPKMIWGEIEESVELLKLKNQGDFKPHIMLARINSWKLRQFEQEEIPELHHEVDLSFRVDSIFLIEGNYKKIKEFKLK